MEIGTELPTLSAKQKIISSILPGVLYAGLGLLFDYLMNGELRSIYSHLFQGVVFGFFVGFGLPYFARKLGPSHLEKIGNSIKPDLAENERIEVEGPANLFRGIEGVGGKLFLTNEKLTFKAHKLNIQNGQTTIDYKQITEVSRRKTAKLLDNGIRIKTADGKKHDFVLGERDLWIEKINEKVA
ncbi:hypothetical protein J0A68_12535 [Algoriphagus sp. H41]|uniref:GRAM domain-containing protein n=1 Tax=Algoriphagus oliviformis TaxID=2811231 RepID=A0ABS3C3T2_9BACT|nr:GRAM domain-containing protein [Algoriphagus oliviformis]MBN7811777.1 hypothetical protein [Algoriphagus oliviformis]